MSSQAQVAVLLQSVLEHAFEQIDHSLNVSVAELAVFAAERSAHLKTIVGQRDYAEAVQAETLAVMTRGGIQHFNEAGEFDERTYGVVEAGLRVAVLMLV